MGMSRVTLISAYILHVVYAPLFCQILQDHPELCGRGKSRIPVPAGLTAAINPTNGDATLEYAGRKIALDGVNDEIWQVCPLPAGKLVIFGFNGVGYEISIVDLKRGEVSDSFLAYDPAMSPNQRWIAYRNFVPPQSEVQFSEEYLLYDLEISASGNRHSVTQATNDIAGWAMYPTFPGNAPFDPADIPDAKQHNWRSESFVWAPDSGSLLFADSVGDRLSLVFIEVSERRLQAYRDIVSAKAVCSEAGGVTRTLTLKGASLRPSLTNSAYVQAIFHDSGEQPRCQPHPLNVNTADFRPARVEVYPHRRLKPPKRIESAQ